MQQPLRESDLVDGCCPVCRIDDLELISAEEIEFKCLNCGGDDRVAAEKWVEKNLWGAQQGCDDCEYKISVSEDTEPAGAFECALYHNEEDCRGCPAWEQQ